MAVAQAPIYREVYHFLASAPTHEQIIGFRPSPEIQERIRTLLAANKAGNLSVDEQAELDEFEQLEHFVRMLKLYTQQIMDK